jgi:tetratricopeptide (TPR) repeat protein
MGSNLPWRRALRLITALWLIAFLSRAADAQQSLTDEIEALNKKVTVLIQKGLYADAIPQAQKILADTEHKRGPNQPDVVTSLTRLAELYRKQCRYAEAEPLYYRALTIEEEAIGFEHPSVAAILNDLAVLLIDEGRYCCSQIKADMPKPNLSLSGL